MSKLPVLGYKELVKVFEGLGYKHIRTKGDHMIFEKHGSLRPVVIPKYKNVPIFIIKNNLKSAGLSEEEFLKLLRG
ncbi:hypothetical protein COT50_01145 [candidate division WWE3 bacterium CG08_land_8_20_14_0_20_41_10]|uniref:Type II toxin-antitoxin system HicA family toxin n=1 Tax=candidate division WWE3 bacterium CG08_land_8_20_14_0_20_41_10 TaxID=1975085 RepID=A0A2H0XCG4_UNCKA|nr:MAG: hypothetical protein COT50_01145 [candidate division WWE3 bacterium CG08_land_8_20_14_0_20_41_10]